MSTRLGFRPRPVDPIKQLNIVRDENELDKEDNSKDASADGVVNEKKQEEPKKAKEMQDIPIPPVTLVPTYYTDYLPLHSIGLTYQKAPSRAEAEKDTTEYDLDLDDVAFLRTINQEGQDRLTDKSLEMLLWRLETANAEATERSLSQAGATAAERSAYTAAATTDHLPKAYALELLQAMSRCQEHIVERVYDYWKDKRKSAQKPALRRLQAPTPESDNNPFLVFRMRAKPNRPQTRRRRETQDESLEKLRMLRLNLDASMKLAQMVLVRERKKLDIVVRAKISKPS